MRKDFYGLKCIKSSDSIDFAHSRKKICTSESTYKFLEKLFDFQISTCSHLQWDLHMSRTYEKAIYSSVGG